MTIAEALDIVVGRTQCERYRWLCRDDNPDTVQRDKYRALVLRLAGEPTTPYPPVATQIGNALQAAGRVAGSLSRGECITVPQAERARRLAICEGCEYYDAGRARCRVCGCAVDLKALIASEHCPIGKW